MFALAQYRTYGWRDVTLNLADVKPLWNNRCQHMIIFHCRKLTHILSPWINKIQDVLHSVNIHVPRPPGLYMNIFTVYFQLRRAVSPLPTALPTMHPGHTRGAGFPFNPSPLFCLNTFPLFLSPPITSLLVYLLESSPPPLLKPSPSLSLSLSLSHQTKVSLPV